MEKWRNEFGSEGKRVAKFSQPLRNGPAKLACSCKNVLRNFAVQKCPAKIHYEISHCETLFENDLGCNPYENDILSENFLPHNPTSEIEQFLQNKHNSIK